MTAVNTGAKLVNMLARFGPSVCMAFIHITGATIDGSKAAYSTGSKLCRLIDCNPKPSSNGICMNRANVICANRLLLTESGNCQCRNSTPYSAYASTARTIRPSDHQTITDMKLAMKECRK